jgi:sulfoxide reductase heme-binding subunit YedZ
MNAQGMAGRQEEEETPPLLEMLAPLISLEVLGLVLASSAGQQTVWYFIRASGIIAFVLLGVSVAMGLLITGRVLPSGRPRVDANEVHNFTALLGLGLSGVHGVALLLDSFIGFSPLQILVPFTATYRPIAVSLGILGFYVMVLVYASLWARRFIGYRAWRTLHYLSFVAFVLGSLHGILAGSDSGAAWMIAIYAGSIGAVLALTWRRISQSRRRRQATSSRPIAA